MQVYPSRFGQIEVDPDTIIQFPLGIPGFEDCKNYKLLHEENLDPKVLWLQSLDDATVLFTLVETERLGLNYALTLSDEECQQIDLITANDAKLFLILSRPEGQAISANTNAPLVINLQSRKGLQKLDVKADIVFRNT
ncbi:flagellar assembly protein FliW [Deefgea sp. CFH1-16]|uniref:flagellar assembly protein FliW n=1 Tax=Deefgea sp. CFH1-16 TaxID=2675457 RepID=UPI0015F3B180|nr:flagellar assembly protein FliW [Deefgea sp. CFH1-16]MBM5575279.1 flagellar biosynthesis protein FliW [Deefgea sp. CFH1-16]